MDILNELEKDETIVTPKRNTKIIDLTEGDILVNGDELQHVAEGEVSIYADGTIDTSNGELALIDHEAVGYAIAAGKTIFNMGDLG